MNQTASAERPRRKFFRGSVPLAGVARFSAECLFESDRWAGALFNSTKPTNAAGLPSGSVSDGPSDGPYPGMFIQRRLN